MNRGARSNDPAQRKIGTQVHEGTRYGCGMEKFKSLDVWKVAYSMALAAYRATQRGPLSRHFGLADQIRRAAVAIPANLAEGYGLSTRLQLIRCTRIALGSAHELGVHLQLATDLELLNPDQSSTLQPLCQRTTQLLIGLLRGLKARLP